MNLDWTSFGLGVLSVVAATIIFLIGKYSKSKKDKGGAG